MDVGDVHLPKIVRLLGRSSKSLCGLIYLGRSLTRLLKQSTIPHDDVRLSIRHDWPARGTSPRSCYSRTKDSESPSLPRLGPPARQIGLGAGPGRFRIPSSVAVGTNCSRRSRDTRESGEAEVWEQVRRPIFSAITRRVSVVSGISAQSFFKTRLAIVNSPMTWSRLSIWRSAR